ncbi:hypothetical protein K503DRAFT_867922 [Rhizopogon vinicolor AM-OR11-026]|uniref:G domain-containing protein n=1 Tax=Rhizopogon vinicolor AM-OR11-026 TaxID=1314800 RepID=A0A1B7MTP3_9AGAM|nr:hypothetical protein K503DRAFT_867922 [Rhizopogon vinicolor AM-OR11-026]
MSAKNIVLFGLTGAGKSSVVNLMAGKDIAKTSPDMLRGTLNWSEYPIAFDGHRYKVFDTVGLEEPQLGIQEYLETILKARDLITTLDSEGGVDLLLFCVRAGRVTATLQSNYRLFYEWLCEKKVPIVLVLTGLEREQNMEDWWDRNKDTFDKYKISVEGHACITAANNLDGRHQHLYQLSRQLVRNLVKEHTYDRPEGGWKGGDGWFKSFMSNLKKLLPVDLFMKKKDIVTVLTERCGVPLAAAVELARQIRE